MTSAHLFALLESLALYLLLAAACIGYGLACLRVLIGRSASREAGPLVPWIGWAVLLVSLEAVHLVVPLRAWIVLPVLLGGAALAAMLWRPRSPRFGAARIAALSALALLAAWIASRAMMRPTLFDAGLYYFSTMRWFTEHAIVPGLGNLHGRLAYNQSEFVWAAALDLQPWFGHGRSIANAFLLLLATVTLLRMLLANEQAQPAWHGRVAAALALPALMASMLSPESLSSPAPDAAVLLVELVLCAGLVRELGRWSSGESIDSGAVLALAMLAATAITLKLSALAFAAAVLAVCGLRALRARGALAALGLLWPVGLVLAIWMIRGYVMSGVPMYPSTLGRIAFDWAVPVARIEEEVRWIRSWARLPGAQWQDVLGSTAWFDPWFARLRGNKLLIWPFLAGSVLLASAVPLAILRRRAVPALWLAPIPAAAGIVFWYYTAPDPRFAAGVFWSFGVAAAVVFLHHVQTQVRHSLFVVVIVVTWLVVNRGFLVPMLDSATLLRIVSRSGWQPMPKPSLAAYMTLSGLGVWVAGGDQRCFDAPLPCAPHFDPLVAARRPGDLGAGFRIQPVDEAR